MDSLTSFIKISQDVPLDGQSYVVFNPGHYTSLFNAWLYQLCNIPELRKSILAANDQQLKGKEILSALHALFYKVHYVEVSAQIQTAKALLMLAKEKYHPESPFAQLPKPILGIIIQYCSGAEGSSLLNIPPRINHIDASFVLHKPGQYEKQAHQIEWMLTLWNQGQSYLGPISGKLANIIISSCSHTSIHTEDYPVLDLPIKGSVLESLQWAFNEENLVKENKYFCSHCQAKYDAIKQCKIQQPSQYLLMQFQRQVFNWDTVRYEWIDTGFAVDKILDISSVVTPKPESQILYELCGLVISYPRNVGTSAVIKDNKNRWIFYDLYKGYLDVTLVKDIDEELKFLQSTEHFQSQFSARKVHGLVYQRLWQ